ncbi:MAG: hypothetical protein ACFB50_02560 [Rubrobacteraceae bacterium]
MVEVGNYISELEGVKFGRSGGETTLGELPGDAPLVLVFLRHFG